MDFCCFLIISDVTAVNLRCCRWKTTCSSDGRSTIIVKIHTTHYCSHCCCGLHTVHTQCQAALSRDGDFVLAPNLRTSALWITESGQCYRSILLTSCARYQWVEAMFDRQLVKHSAVTDQAIDGWQFRMWAWGPEVDRLNIWYGAMLYNCILFLMIHM